MHPQIAPISVPLRESALSPFLVTRMNGKVVGPAGGGDSPGWTPFLPTDGARALSPASQASCMTLRQDIPGRKPSKGHQEVGLPQVCS